MNQCANCGQVNTDTSNFCRFCGTRFTQTQMSNENNYEYSPPRPYSWKTDEFQVGEKKQQKNPPSLPPPPAQPLNNPYLTHQTARPPQPLVYQQPNNLVYGYHCPRCATQALPMLTKKISTAGWVTFAVLLAVFFPLFWIGLLIKEDVRVCPVCQLQIG